MTELVNLIEPRILIEHFQTHPPEGFTAFQVDGVPAFATKFDLLTTIDPALRRRIDALTPRRLRALLRRPAMFAGTTVSTFALLPSKMPGQFVERILAEASRSEFIIIKDLPCDATLVDRAAFDTTERVMAACVERGFVQLEGQALAYVPIDFASIDDFLNRLSHARRKNIRRKLKSRGRLTIDCVPTGDPRFKDENFLGLLYALYRNVYDQSEVHFDLLTPSFFRAVLRDASAGGRVFLYTRDAELIGYNLCFQSSDTLIDQYVGFRYPQARECNLYAVSWFNNLEYALVNGLKNYVAGWTDPAVKRELGAKFTMTRHAVYVRNPVLRRVLRSFKGLFESDHRWARRAAAARS